jgi:hypothetical protein
VRGRRAVAAVAAIGVALQFPRGPPRAKPIRSLGREHRAY